MENTDFIRLSELFKVFADSSRLTILDTLLDGELCVSDILKRVSMSQSAVSHQLNGLRGSGLVKTRREGRSIFYSLADEHVYEIMKIGKAHIME